MAQANTYRDSCRRRIATRSCNERNQIGGLLPRSIAHLAYAAILFAVALPTARAGQSAPQSHHISNVTATLNADADTYLRPGPRNQNFGDERFLRVRASDHSRTLVRFDPFRMSSYGPGPIGRVTLELYIDKSHNEWAQTSRNIDIHRLTEDWTEHGATWNCAIDANTRNQKADCEDEWSGGAFEQQAIDSVLHAKHDGGWVGFDVTADFNAVLSGRPHFGWLLKETTESRAGFVSYVSREGPADFRPRLVIDTAADTPTPTTAPSHTPVPTHTPSATATQVPPGILFGAAFDDETSLPLAGVSVNVDGVETATTDRDGRYAIAAQATDTRVELSKNGYTRALRRMTTQSQAAVRIRDTNLTRLDQPLTVGSGGATIATTYTGPTGRAAVELTVPPGTLADGSEVRLTMLGPQGLIVPPPLGWSVLLASDVQIDPTPDPALAAGWATLRIPLSLVFPGASLPLTVGVWDEQSTAWIAGPTVQVNADNVELSLPPPISGLSAATLQIALLVADTLPVAPAAAVEGTPLARVEPALIVNPSAVALASPEVVLSDTRARAFAFAEVFSDADVPSGTLLQARLRERYDLRDGDVVEGVSSRQDVAAYQVSPRTDASSRAFLGAYLTVAPSRSIPIDELSEGRIDIEVDLPDAAGEPALVDTAGGEVSGRNGLRIIVPANATGGPIVLDLSPVPAASLPVAHEQVTQVSGAFTLDAIGGSLAPTAAYEIDLGTPVADGDRFVIGRVEVVGGRLVLRAVGFAVGSGGRVVFDPCAPAAPSLCLGGLHERGTYAVIALPASSAIASGLVTDGSGLRPGVAVEADTALVVSVSNVSGVYVLPVPLGEVSTLLARDPANDLTGSVLVEPSAPDTTVLADIALLSTPPRVIQIDPPNHGSGVATDAPISVVFSEPILASSLVPGTVELSELDGGRATVVPGRVSLAAGGTRLVFTPAKSLGSNTLYAFSISAAITDLAGASPLPLENHSTTALRTHFTTGAIFTADALPPNTLRVSLPVDRDANVVSLGETGEVFVCGGAQFAVPGTTVVLENEASGQTTSVDSTTAGGVSASTACDALFPGRCDTSGPGSFCAILDGLLGERMLVHVEDAFGNVVTLDAGNMRDEITGAEVVGPEGADVTFAGDERYQALIPKGAFEEPTIVTIRPIEPDPSVPGMLDLFDVDHPDFAALTNPDLNAHVELVGAVRVDFDPPNRVLRKQYDVALPYSDAPSDAEDGQYLAARVVSFRQRSDGMPRFELTTVDTAHFEIGTGRVITDPSVFPGLIIGGTFGLFRPVECVGFVSGWVTAGDHFGSDAAGWIGGGFLGLLPFPVDEAESQRFDIPIPCNTAVSIVLHGPDDSVLDSGCGCGPGIPPVGPTANGPDGECRVGRAETAVLKCTLSTAHLVPSLLASSVKDGEDDVDPLASPQATFNEAVSVPPDALMLVDSKGNSVRGHVEVKRTTVTFIPDIRLRYGETYRLELSGVLSTTGDRLPSETLTFTTRKPLIVAHLPVDALDVKWLDPTAFPAAAGLTPCTDLIAVAEGDASRRLPDLPLGSDFAGGVLVYDVSDLSDAGKLVAVARTAGTDRALTFASGPPVRPLDRTQAFPGPFLMSVDGIGPIDRFGVWRLFDLSRFPAMTEVSARLVNQSFESMARIQGTDSPLAPPLPYGMLDLVAFVPNDVGVPSDVASFGTQVAYIANPPFIGLEAILPNFMRADVLTDKQVHGFLQGIRDPSVAVPIRAVTTLPDPDPSKASVVAVAEKPGAQNELLLIDPRLSTAPHEPLIASTFELPTDSKALAVAALKGWPTRLAPGDEETVPRDLVISMCEGAALCVVPVDTEKRRFDENLAAPGLSLGHGEIRTQGKRPRAAVGDAATQLLFVADGTAGLAIIDLAVPGGSRDDDGDGVDDRVLGTVDLDGADADAVTAWRDFHGDIIVAVATGTDGIFFVNVGRAKPRLYLEGIPRGETFDGANRVVVEEVRYFNEKESSFYEPVVEFLGSELVDAGPAISVRITALDTRGDVPEPPAGDFAESIETVTLGRIPGTNRYHLNPDGTRTRKLIVSNLPLTELGQMREECPGPTCTVIYGGFAGKLRLEILDAGQPAGCAEEVPVEKIQVILLGIDGLRQDVLYPDEPTAAGGGDSVQEDGTDYYLDPDTLPGIGQLFGRFVGNDGEIHGDTELHHYRFPDVVGVFPSVTLANWASIYTGAVPNETGLVGNEFFARDLIDAMENGEIPLHPISGAYAPGVVSFLDGAFDRSPLDIGELNGPDVTPPGTDDLGRGYRFGDWDLTPQNRILRDVPTLFEQVRPILDASGAFASGDAAMIGDWQLYARGLARPDSMGPDPWLIPRGLEQAIDVATQHFGLFGVKEDRFLDEWPVDFATAYLDDHGVGMGTPFPALLTTYFLFLDHQAHEQGHGDDGSLYKSFFRDRTDKELERFVAWLRDHDELHNKIFVITSDHGQTNIQNPEPAPSGIDLTPCDAGKAASQLEGDRKGPARLDEQRLNRTLTTWEMAALFDQFDGLLPPEQLDLRLLLQDPVLRLFSPFHPLSEAPLLPVRCGVELLPCPVTKDIAQANVIAAFNGPMAQIYVRNGESTGGEQSIDGFKNLPTVTRNGVPAEVALVAEALLVALTEYHSPYLAFPGDDDHRRMHQDNIKKLAGGMRDSVDFILYRDNGAYRVFKGITASGTIESEELSSLAQRNDLAYPVERLAALNDANRSGDIIVHFKLGLPADRYSTGSSCRGDHGSLKKTDSFVPLIVAYPGGNKEAFLSWWNERGEQAVCRPPATDDTENLDCHGSWMTTEIIRELLKELYPPEVTEP